MIFANIIVVRGLSKITSFNKAVKWGSQKVTYYDITYDITFKEGCNTTDYNQYYVVLLLTDPV